MSEDTYQVEEYDEGEGWSPAAIARFRDARYASGLTREEVEEELARAMDAT